MNRLEIHILRRLYDHTYIGRRHAAITDLRQGLPKEKRIMNDLKNVVKDLINNGFLLPHHGDRVSINPKRLGEIRQAIR
jgi:hypothetical protein